MRQETGWNQPQRMREAPNRFFGGVSDTLPAFAHETRNTAVLDGTKQYCTRYIVFFWQPPSCFFRNGRPPVPRSKAFLIPAANNSSLQRKATRRDKTSRACPTLASTSNMVEKHVNFDLTVLERERENIVLVGFYATFTQNPSMQSHLLGTGDRLLAEASPYDLTWGIGYSADHVSARQPTLWRGFNLLGKTLQTVRRLFRDRAPPPTRHQLLSPQGISHSRLDCIFEDPSTRQRLCPEDTSAAASSSGYPLSLPHVPSDHGGDVLAVMSAAHSDQHSPMLAEQGPCLVAGVRTMDDFSFTNKIKIHSGPVAVQLGCVALLDTGSPQTFINTHALESMKRASVASAICERHTPPRSWKGFGKSPPLQASAAVRLIVQLFQDDQATASLAVWVYVVLAEAMQHDVLLGRDSWRWFNDRS